MSYEELLNFIIYLYPKTNNIYSYNHVTCKIIDVELNGIYYSDSECDIYHSDSESEYYLSDTRNGLYTLLDDYPNDSIK